MIKKSLFIYIILFAALVLRLQHLNQPYIDAFSWRQSSTAMMAENFFNGNWNILYPEVNWTGPGHNYQGREFQTISYITALLYKIWGIHDWVGRLVAIFFGIWGIFSLYQLVRRVWDEQHALAAALVMAILPGGIFIDRSFLPDPVMVSLVTTSLWLLVAYLQTDRLLYLCFAALSGCLAFLTKIPGLLIILPMAYAVIVILRNRQKLSSPKLIFLSIVGIVTLVPVILYYLWARHLALTHPPYHFAGSGNWVWDQGLRSWVDQRYFVKDLKNVFLYWLWDVPVMGLTFIGLILSPPLFKPTQQKEPAPAGGAPWLFHVWLAGCIFYYFIGAKELISNAWNFHIFNPVAAAFAGRAIVIITTYGTSKFRTMLFRLASIIIVIFFSGYYLLKDYLYTTKNAFLSYNMGVALNKLSKPGDLVVTIAQDMGDPVSIYYSHRKGWVFPPAREWAPKTLPAKDEESITDIQDLKAKGANWFGIAANQYYDLKTNHSLFAKYILDHYQLVSQTSHYVIFKL